MDRKRGQKPSRGMCKAFHEACKSNYDAMHLKCRLCANYISMKLEEKKKIVQIILPIAKQVNSFNT